MAEGRFSRPRPNRDESRQIEETFQALTGQSPVTPPRPAEKEITDPLDFSSLLSEEELGTEADAPRKDPAPVLKLDGFDYDDEEPYPPRRGPKKMLLILCAAAVLLVIAVIAVVFLKGSDPYGGKILSGVYLGDVNVGGMTKSEASAAMKTTAERYETTDMVVSVGSETLVFTPKDTKVQLDIKDAVNAAYDYGRKGSDREQQEAYAASRTENHTIGLLPYLNLDANYIRSSLAIYGQQSGSTLTQTAYGMEGSRPELAADKFDKNAPGQTLIIRKGTPGTGFDIAQANDRVLDAYSLCSFAVTVEAVTTESEPDPLDWDALYAQYCVAPVDGQIDPDTLEPIPGSYGCEFDLELAKAQLDSAQYGEEIRIPMVYTPPKEAEKPELDMDILGEYQTRFTDDTARNANLVLACQAIDGTVVEPGETFSMNSCLGERTAENGYLEAPAYVENPEDVSMGGGISQVASTLYYAALLSDLEIVSREPHSAPASFIPYGLDANIGPDTDFSFRNTTSFPIQLEADISGGNVTVRILGTDQRDYYIRLEYEITATLRPVPQYININPNNNREGYKNGDVIQEGSNGYNVKTYRVKYDKETNALISRDYETTTRYPTVNTQIARLYTAGPVQQEPEVHQPAAPVEPNPDDDNPGGETPGGETPGGETPGGETPGGETPGDETPGGETPGGETPGGETPGGETPGGETPGGETPGGETPGGETPGGETPGGETPGGETPGGETPGGETPGGETPGGETPGGETPGGETPGGDETPA